MARQMKDSGIPYLGGIPASWGVQKLRYSVMWKSEKGYPDAEVLALYRDYGVIPKSSRDDNYNVTSLDTSTYKYVEVGDFVINKMKAWQGSMGISPYSGIISPAYHVCAITNEDIHRPYFHYLLRNVGYLPEFARLSTGLRIGQWDLSFDDFRNLPFLLPDKSEQERIATILDAKCAEIDKVVEQTRATIEEYKKLKQAIITEAVTKGVRGPRPMKPSGVEWIGDIPEEWSCSRVGRHYYITLGKMLCTAAADDSYSYEPYYCAADVHFEGVSPIARKKMWFSQGEKKDLLVKKGDLLVTEGGTGGCAIVQECVVDTYIQNSLMIVRGKANAIETYLRYWLESLIKRSYLDYLCNKVTIIHFTKEKLSKVPFPVPSLDEQKEIATYLNTKCAKIDRIIEKKEQLIEELGSYKKSLIYEYVTGKKEVTA